MYFTDSVVKAFLWDTFLKLSICIKCKVRRKVLYKLIFIFYNMEPLPTLRARWMRRWWRRRRIWESSHSLRFPLLLIFLFSSSTCRTRLWKKRCATSFPCFSFLVRFFSCWIRISLNNFLLFFEPWEPLLIFLIFLRKGIRVWAPWTLLLHAHDVERIQHSFEIGILWKKIIMVRWRL